MRLLPYTFLPLVVGRKGTGTGVCTRERGQEGTRKRRERAKGEGREGHKGEVGEGGGSQRAKEGQEGTEEPLLSPEDEELLASKRHRGHQRCTPDCVPLPRARPPALGPPLGKVFPRAAQRPVLHLHPSLCGPPGRRGAETSACCGAPHSQQGQPQGWGLQAAQSIGTKG